MDVEPAPGVGANNPDHDMPDVGDNAEAPNGGNNPPPPDRENPPPGPNIQTPGAEQQRRQFHPRSKILMAIHKVTPIFTILNLLKEIKRGVNL